MKLSKLYTIWLQLLFIIMAMPAIMGETESGCDISRDLISTLKGLVKGKMGPSTTSNQVYITNLTFMDDVSKTMLGQPEEAKLINEAVVDGIERVTKSDSSYKHNDPKHSIPNTVINGKNFVEIFSDPNSSPQDTFKKLDSEFLGKFKVDVIVTGTYRSVEQEDKVVVSPMIVSKSSQNITGKKLEFTKDEYFCEDENSTKPRKTLCPNAHEEIAKVVEELLQAL